MPSSTTYKNYPYFKIKWSLAATWSKEEAAYLAMGEDPANSKFKISAENHDKVSKCFYWLKAQQRSGKFGPDETTIDGIERVNTGSLYRLLKSEYVFDGEMDKIFRKIRYGKPPITDILSPSIYRRAGKIIFDDCKATGQKPSHGDVAKVLIHLHQHMADNDELSLLMTHLTLQNKQAHQIEQYLAGLSLLKPGEKSSLTAPIQVDWDQLIEKL